MFSLCKRLAGTYTQVIMFTTAKFLLSEFEENFLFQSYTQEEMNKKGFMKDFFHFLEQNKQKTGKMT